MRREPGSFVKESSRNAPEAVFVTGRRGGGDVGVAGGINAQGNPIVVSGNTGNRIREAPISRGRIHAYLMPTS